MAKRIRLRTLLFGGIITLLFLILIVRVYYVQVVDDTYFEMAKQRWAAAETLTAKRGTITDRDGNVLAMDAIAFNVSVNPKLINEAGIEKEVIDGLHDILGIPREELQRHVMAKRDNGEGDFFSHREIRQGGWQIEKALADEINTFRAELRAEMVAQKKGADTGIYVQQTLKRYYPRQSRASHVVGYIDINRENTSGIEAFFNDRLTGEDGYIRYEKDGQRVQLAKGEVEFQPAVDGDDIALTIDSDIQQYVEEALREIVEKYAPKSATAIAADPNTMEILAMANMPEFNPNDYWNYTDNNYSSFYNHAVGSLYEPGSTFKIATLAAAVEEGLFDPDELYKSGSYRVPGDTVTIRDHNRDGWGTISFLDGLKYSSNVAFVKLGFERLGAERLRDYFTRFGFGQKTGIELANESSGSIRFQWNSEIAAASFGQGVSVTAIQQVAAVAAVANGGKLMEPQLVKSITDPVSKTTTVIEPKMIRQVISPETSRQVSQYLEQVVSDREKGTGRNAYIEGYRVAGKTGTAQKYIGPGYSTTQFMVSFIGYAPVDNPKIVVYIAVDEPNDSLVGGGTVAAPAFRDIVLKSLRKMGVAPSFHPSTESASREVTVAVPDMTELKVAQARAEMKARAMNYELVGDGGEVLHQIPAPGSLVHPTQRIYLITEQRDRLAVPDLTGVSLRDALELTAMIGARLAPEGTGFVVSQKVEESGGERIVRVILSPPEGSESYVALSDDDLFGEDEVDGEADDSGEPENGEHGDDAPDNIEGIQGGQN